MNKNSEAIVIFCSHLCAASDIKPLEPREWGELASILFSKGLEPKDLLFFSKSDFLEKLEVDEVMTNRYLRLLERSGSISFEISKYENMGIMITTRAENNYPRLLKQKLGNNCPPIFYAAGNMELLNKQSVGFVGSRNVSDNDIDFTKNTVTKILQKGYGVVTGGAKGIDTTATQASLDNNGFVIEYLADSMMQKMRKSDIVKSINKGDLLILSAQAPTAGFNVGFAMMRNKYIYSQSDATIIIKSDKDKGGTWNGAIENLKKGWCTEYCRNIEYPGNLELIKMGAIPIDENWDGTITKTEFDKSKVKSIQSEVKKPDGVQLSLFD